jgi:hypothetical protein
MSAVIEAAKSGLYWLLWKGLLSCEPVFRIRILIGSGSRIAKMTTKIEKRKKKFHVLKFWMFSLEA